MPIVVTVKVRPRYILAGNLDAPIIYDRVTKEMHGAERPHRRAYKSRDWIDMADYLNDRITGYPVPSALLPLRSEHNEDRRQAHRRRPTRRTRRVTRK